MGNITIKKISGKVTETLPLTFNIKNLVALDVMLETPALVYAIPESEAIDAIGMKVEGNTMLINISWTLVDNDATLVDQLTGGAAVETADEQMAFLMDTFQSASVSDNYEFKLFPNNSNGNDAFFTRTGILTKASVNKTGNTPVTYVATVIFAVANMTTAADAQEASP